MWYLTMGVLVALTGVFDLHPFLAFRTPWWVRGPIIGAWMNFVLACFLYETLEQVLSALDLAQLSPFVLVFESALVGGLIGYVATKVGGEGAQTLGLDSQVAPPAQ
jgi:hypothetical protein